MSLPLVLAGALGLAAQPAAAEEPPPAPVPEVELQDLLRLPDGLDYSMERRGGAGPDEWRRRFQEARADLVQAQTALRESLAELDEKGQTGAWKMAPPGLGQLQQKQQDPTNPGAQADAQSPLDYGLSNSIRGQKEDVKRAERALRKLQVEANLANVPQSWRGGD